MAITTLEKCADETARHDNVVRLVDTIRDPGRFATPPSEKVSEIRQAEYEALPETPFFVGVPREIYDAARDSVRVGDVARGRQGLITADDRFFLAGIDARAPYLGNIISSDQIATTISPEERIDGIAPGRPQWVPFAKGEGLGEYWKPPTVAINWSTESVEELRRRDSLPAGTSGRPRFQNRDFYFEAGLTYSVVASAHLSVRLMPEGWIFSGKGSAIFVEDDETSKMFLLGYLNSALTTFFMKKVVNTTATADLGYIERLPYRRPGAELEAAVVTRVESIVQALKADSSADVSTERNEINDLIFDLFDIGVARAEVEAFYRTVGRVGDDDPVED